jgi:hypothetical protein
MNIARQKKCIYLGSGATVCVWQGLITTKGVRRAAVCKLINHAETQECGGSGLCEHGRQGWSGIHLRKLDICRRTHGGRRVEVQEFTGEKKITSLLH